MAKAKKKVEKELAPQEKRLEGLFKAMQEAGLPIKRVEEIWEFFPEFIYMKLEEKGETEAVEWNIEDVKEYFKSCRLEDWGNPTIQTGFAKREFTEDKAMLKCVGGFDVFHIHKWFKNIPPEMIELVKDKGNWEDWAKWMKDNGHLTDQEYDALLNAPFLMRKGEGLEKKPPVKPVKKRRRR